METPEDVRLTLAEIPDEEARNLINRELQGFNDTQSPAVRAARAPGQGSLPLDVYLTDASGQVVGGLVGFTVWGWLYVDNLWLDAPLRKRGFGTRLMQAAEVAARRRGCTHAHLRTFSFQARGFYEKLGYRVIGQLDDYPPGASFYWLRKDFA